MNGLSIVLLVAVVVLLVLLLQAKASARKLKEENARLAESLMELDRNLTELQAKIPALATEQAQKIFNEWKAKELEEQKKLISQSIEGQYKAKFEEELRKRAEELQKKFEEQFQKWKETELQELKKTLEENFRKEYETKFQEWKQKEEEKIRKDAISRSTATILGRIGEQLAPLLLLTNYGINPKEVRFLGQPVDFIAFKGLEEGNLEEIIFIEVKSGKSKNLTARERAIKKAIEEKRVSWITFHTLSEVQRMKERALRGEEHFTEGTTPQGIENLNLRD